MNLSNFDFLRQHIPELREDAVHTEASARTAPRTCAFYARRSLEQVIQWMYARDSYLKRPYQDNLAALIHEPTFKDTVAPSLFNQIKLIHKLGNLAVHSNSPVNATDGLQVTRCLHLVMSWLAKSYIRPQPAVPAFDDQLLPLPADSSVQDRTAEQLSLLQEQLQSKDDAFRDAQNKLASTEEELAKIREEIQRIKAENRKTIADEDYSEAATRDLFIDLLLREAGWDPHGLNVSEYEVTGMPNNKGLGYVDYVLWGDDGLPLAIVEAKRTKLSATKGQRQAELYADCLQKMTGRRPIIFYTNGYETWLWDDEMYVPRQVQGFYTKDELTLMINRRTSRGDIASLTPNRQIVDRYYQEEAVRRVMEAFQNEKAREALLVMATGAGKTRLAIAAIELLMQQNWVRRVLFLADRTALVRQAKRAFAKHLPNVTVASLLDSKDEVTARIVLSTYPTMLNLIDEQRVDGQKRFGVGHFDLIVIDEAHRSVYQKFAAIFIYHDGMLLGLTATPKADVDRNTYELFKLQDHVPTYAYELKTAISDGFLVPPRTVSVPLKFQRHGITYDDLSDKEKEEYEETFFDEESGQIPPGIDAGALNNWLFNQDTVDKVLQHLMTKGLKVSGGDRIGKTIIFAKNQKHAEFIVKRFDANYKAYAGKWCRMIHNKVDYAQTLIDDFGEPNKPPYIAVSVDMMDTGIDVPEVLNLVFFKMVRSKTKFWQMMGRGTRLCPDIFGPGQHKNEFFVFDYCQNLEFFKANAEGAESGLQESVKQKVFKRRLSLSDELSNVEACSEAESAELETLHTDLLDQMHDCVKKMDTENFIVRMKRRYVEEFTARGRWKTLSHSDVGDIRDHLTGLPWPDDDEELARRFDLLMLNLQLSILDQSPQQERYQRQVRSLGGKLEEKKSIPSVAQQMELILDIQTDEYWQHITLPMLERARRKLRDLIKFIDKTGGQEIVYTNFEDEIGEGQEIYDLIQRDDNLKNYRLKVEKFVRENNTHPVIQQLQRNEPIAMSDIESLEAILFSDAGPGTREDYEATYGEQPLGTLIRQILGLELDAAKAAFGTFLGSHSHSADQITFVNQIIEYLAFHGTMEPDQLFRSPFTDAHSNGVVGVFPQAADEIVEIIRSVNNNALAS